MDNNVQGLSNRNLPIDQAVQYQTEKQMAEMMPSLDPLTVPRIPSELPIPAPSQYTGTQSSSSVPSLPQGPSIPGVSNDPGKNIANAFSSLQNRQKTAQDETFGFASDIPKSAAKRYDTYYPGLDTEDIEAKKQGAMQVLGKSLYNAGVSFSKTFLESTVGTIAGVGYGIGNLTGQTDQGFTDNPVVRTLSAMEDWKSPVYETKERRDAPWYSPTYWWSGNSLNTALGTFGDLAAFWLTGKIFAAPIAGMLGKGALYASGAEKGLSEGISAIDKMGIAEYNEAISNYSKLATGLEGDALKQAHAELLEQLNTIKSSGLADAQKWEAATKSLADISAKYSTGIKAANYTQQIAAGVITNLGMAQSSGYQTMTAFKEKMLDSIYKEGRIPTPEEEARIDRLAHQAGSTDAFLMALMGAATLHGITKQTLSKIGGKEAGELLTSKTSKIVRAAEDAEIELESGEKLKVPKYEEAKYVADKSKGTFKNFTGKTWYMAKQAPGFIQKRIDLWPGIGMVEFGLASKGVQNYYEAKYKKGKDPLNEGFFDIDWSSVGESILKAGKERSAKDYISDIVLGSLTAMPFEYGAKSGERKQVKENTQKALEALNDRKTFEMLRANTDMANRHTVLYGQMLDAVKTGDKETEKTLQSQIIENWIFPKVKYGQTKFLMDELNGYQALSKTPEGVKELQRQGLIPEGDKLTELGDNFRKHIDKIKDRVENTKKYYEAMTLRYGGYLKGEHIEQLVMLSGGIDDLNTRIKELGEKIQKSPIGTDADFMKEYRSVLSAYEQIAASYNKENTVIKDDDGKAIGYIGRVSDEKTKELLEIIESKVSTLNPDQKMDLVRDVADVMKLQLLKKRYFKEYEDILKNPANYENHVQTNIVPPPNQDEIKGNKIDGIKVGNKGGTSISFKVGDQYYTNKEVQPGDGEKFVPFQKFTVDGFTQDETTGKKTIKITDEKGNTMDISEDVFRKYKVNSVKDLNKEGNENALFWMNNRDSKFIYNYADENGNLQWTEGTLREHDSDNPHEFEFVPDDPAKKPVKVDKDAFREKVLDEEGKEREEPRLQKVGDYTAEDMEWLTARESKSELEYKQEKFMKKVEVLYDLMKQKQEYASKIDDEIKTTKDKIKAVKQAVKDIKTLAQKNPDGKVNLNGTLATIEEAMSEMKNIAKNNKEYIKKLSSEKRKVIDQIEDIESLLKARNMGTTMGRTFIEEMKSIKDQLQKIVDSSTDQIKKLTDYVKGASSANLKLVSAAKKIARELLKEKGLDPMDIDNLERFIEREYPDLDASSYGGEMPDYKEDIKMLKSILKERKDLNGKLASEIDSIESEIENLEKDRDSAQKQLDLTNDIINEFNEQLKRAEARQKLEEKLRDPAYTKKLSELQREFNSSYGGISFDDFQTEVPEIVTPNAELALALKKGVTPAIEQRGEGWTGGAGEFKDADGHSWVDRHNIFINNRDMDFPVPQGGKRSDYATEPQFLKFITVSRQNQHHYFGKDTSFIEDVYTKSNGEKVDNTKDTDKATVAMIVVYGTPDGYRFVDKNGKLLGKVSDGNADPKQLVFSRMETTLETRDPDELGKRYQKSHLPVAIQNMDKKAQADYILKTVELASQRRKAIVENTSPSDKFAFSFSIGIDNYERNSAGKIIPQDNAISTTGFISEDKIGTGVLKLTTIKGESGTGQITLANGRVVDVKAGIPVVVNGDTLTGVRTSKIHKSVAEGGKGDESFANHLYEVIEGMAFSRAQSPDAKVNSTLENYIKGVLFFSSEKGKDGNISKNQIHFDPDGDLTFMLNGKKVSMAFTPDTIQANADIIKEWLMQSFHAIDKKALDSKAAFIEVTKVKYENGKFVEPEVTKWSTYEEYLLSAKTPDGKDRSFIPLTTNIVKYNENKPWEGAKKGRYMIPMNSAPNDYFSSAYEPGMPTEAQPSAAGKKPSAPGAEKEALTEVIKFASIDVTLDGKTESVFTGNRPDTGEWSFTFTASRKPDGSIEVNEINRSESISDAQAEKLKENIKANLESAKKPGPAAPSTPPPAPKAKTKGTSGKVEIKGAKSPSITIEDGRIVFEPHEEQPIGGGKPYTRKAILYFTFDETKPEDQQIDFTKGEYIDELDNVKVKDFWSEMELKGNKDIIGNAIREFYKKPEAEEVKTEEVKETKEEVPSFEEQQEQNKNSKNTFDQNLDDAEVGEDLMQVVSFDELPAPGNREMEKSWIEANLGNINYDLDIPEIIKTGSGIFAFGMYKDHYIAVYKGAPEGTGIHEVYHFVEDSFLKPKEIKALRDEFKARKGSFYDRNSRTYIPYDKATERQIRERLAEELRQYVLDNPNFKKPSKITNWFRRFVNFMKHFVFGNPTTVKEVFKKINSGYYYDSKLVKKPRVSEADYMEINSEFTPEDKKGVLDHVTATMFDYIKSLPGGAVRMIDDMTEKDILEPAYRIVSDYFENPKASRNIYGTTKAKLLSIDPNLSAEQKALHETAIKEQAFRATELWKMVKNEDGTGFSDPFMKELKSFVRKFGVVFDPTTNPRLVHNEELAKAEDEAHVEQGKETEDRDRGYESDSLYIDATKNAPLEVKIAFNTLIKVDPKAINPNLDAEYADGTVLKPAKSALSSFQGYQFVDSPSKYIYNVLEEMNGVTDPNEIKRRLYEMAKKDPVLVRLYNDVYKNTSEQNDWNMRIAFTQFVSKTKPNFEYVANNEESRLTIKSSNLDSAAGIIMKNWENELRGDTTGITLSEKGQPYRLKIKDNNGRVTLITPTDANQTIAFLKQIKFPVTDTTMNKLSPKNQGELIKNAGDLHKLLLSQEGNTRVIGTKATDAKAIRNIARLLAKTDIGVNVSTHQNMDNNKVQNFSLHNVITREMGKINSAGTLSQLTEAVPRFTVDEATGEFLDANIRHSVILKKNSVLFDKSGNKKTDVDGLPYTLRETVFEGLHDEDADFKPKKSMAKMNNTLRFLTMLAHGIGRDGYASYPNFIPASAKTERGTAMPYYITPTEYLSPTVRKEVVKDIVLGYLKDEINVIKENLSGKRVIMSGSREFENYKRLQIFKDLFMNKEVDEETGKITYSPNRELVEIITEHAQGKGEYKDLSTNEFVNKIANRVYDAVENTFERDIQQEVDKLEDDGIVRAYRDTNGVINGYKFFGLNSEALRVLSITGKKYSLDSVKDILRFRYLNQFVHLNEMRKLFYGPYADVPDLTKRDKLMESGTLNTYTNDEQFNTWHTQNANKIGDVMLKTDNPFFHQYKDNFNQLTFAEIKSYSNTQDEVSNSYKSMDEMDAQGIILDRYHKEFKIRSGERWSSDDQRQHDYDIASAALALAERNKQKGIPAGIDADTLKKLQEIVDAGNPHIDGTGTPLKPLGAGMANIGGQAVPFSDKTSIIRLTYPIAKERGLEDLYWFMHENDIAMVGPKSWSKYGRPSLTTIADVKEGEPLTEKLPELYKMEGDKVRFGLSDLTDAQLDRVKLNVPWEAFNKIVETAKHGDGVGRGTQTVSLATVNTHTAGLPLDFYNPATEDLYEKQQEWKQLSEKERMGKSDYYRLRKEHDDILVERSRRGYDDSMHKLGVVENKDGSFTFDNPARFISFLEDQVTRQSLPENLKKVLKYQYDPVTGRDVLVTPIEAMADYKDLSNMIWSVIHKNVLTPKMNGTANILVSSTGFEKKGLRVVTNKDGKKFLSSGTLKFYLPGEVNKETGKKMKTSEMEVYAPNFMLKKLKDWANKSGSEVINDKQLFEHLNTPEGQKLLRAIGYRIPTQGLNSIDAIKIKAWDEEKGIYFMPAEMGNSVIVPSEIVTKVGADFDVDKMFTYHTNFYIDSKGYPRAYDFLTDANSTPEQRYIRYISRHNKNAGDMKAKKEESDEYMEMQSKIDAMYEQREESVGELVSAKESRSALNKKLNDIKTNSKDIYEEGYHIFKTLPISMRQTYFKYEDKFKDEAEASGLVKLQLYNQLHQGMIEAVDEMISQGFTDQSFDYRYYDKKKKTHVRSEEIVDLKDLRTILESLKKNSSETLRYNNVKELASEELSTVRNAIKENMIDKLKGIKSELDIVKEAQRKWMLEASKQIAEARGIEGFDEFRNMDLIKQNSTEAVENKYYDTLNEILLHPGNYEQLVTPNSVEELTGILDEMDNQLKQFTFDKDRDAKDVNFSNSLKPLYINEVRQQLRDATDQSIGIAAQNNTLHSQSQLSYIPLQDNYTIKDPQQRADIGLNPAEVTPGKNIPIWLPHTEITYKGEKVTILSGYKNAGGNLISDFISQVINGAVDADKRNWLIELLRNKSALDTFLFVGRLAVDPKHLSYFMRQPIIQEYIKRESIIRETRSITDAPWTDPKAIRSSVRWSTFPLVEEGKRLAEKTTPRTTDFTIEELKSGWLEVEGKGKKMNQLTPEERNFQRQVLDEYFKYVALKDHAFKSQQSNLIINMPRASEAAINLKSKQIDNARNNSVFGTDQETVHGRVFEYLKKADDAYSSIASITKHNALAEVKNVFSDNEKYIDAGTRIDIYNRATMSVLDYAAQVLPGKDNRKINQDIRKLLIETGRDRNGNPINIVDELSAAKASAKGDLNNTLGIILSTLTPNRRFRPEDHKNLAMAKRPESAVEADIITDAFRRLRDNPITNELYEKLFNAGILQYGTRPTKESYYRYLPSEDVVEFMKPIVDKMLDGSNAKIMEAFKNYKAFYRNNYYDDTIVPKMRSSKTEDGRKYYDYYYGTSGMKSYWERITPELKAKGLMKPKMVLLHEIYDKGRVRYPVIKSVETAINKNTGRPYTGSEIEAMIAKGDYSFQQVYLFQKVMNGTEPYYLEDSKGMKSYVYKQINAWGDGNNVQEYYDKIDTDNNIGFSQLDKHLKVPELSDIDIVNIQETGEPLPKSDYQEVSDGYYDKSNSDTSLSQGEDTVVATRNNLPLPVSVTDMPSSTQELLNNPKATVQDVKEEIGWLAYRFGVELSDKQVEDIKKTIDYLQKEFGLIDPEKEKKAMQDLQNQINQNVTEIKTSTVATPMSTTQSKKTIQMQPDNVEKILKGTKTTTIRSQSQANQLGINAGETAVVNIGGKDFNVTNRGLLDIKEAGGVEAMLKSEDVKSIDDFKYEQSKKWARGESKLYVYDIKPVEVKDKTTAEPAETIPGRQYTLPDGRTIQFTNEQYDALQNMKSFHSDPNKTTFTLSGFAGTGKTTIIKAFIDELEEKSAGKIRIGVTAPTHKAVKVISGTTQKQGFTVHKLLGLRPNIDIEKVSQGDLEFDPKNPPLMPNYEGGYVIVDEASMLNKVISGRIKELATRYNVKLLFMGDPAQLPPIGEMLSTVFDSNSVDSINYLTEVKRQEKDNPVMSIYDDIRNNLSSKEDVFSHQTAVKQDGKGIEFTASPVKFESDMIEAFKSERFKKYMDIKALAFRNERVMELNKLVRNALFGEKAPMIVESDLLTSYETIAKPRRKNIVDNSQDYKVLQSNLINRDGMKVHEVSMKETDSNYNTKIYILNNDAESIDRYLEMAKELWDDYEKTKSGGMYARYKDFLNSYMSTQALSFKSSTNRSVHIKKSIDYGYAMTVHKSQGSTYHSVFVDENDIDRSRQIPPSPGQNPLENFILANKLKYVAFSRPTDKVVSFTYKAGEGSKAPKVEKKVTNISVPEAYERMIVEGKANSLIVPDANKIDIGIEQGMSGTQKFGGKDFTITNKGKLSVDEAGGKEAMLKARGASSMEDIKAPVVRDWFEGKGKLWVYDIKPSEGAKEIKENSKEENDKLLNDLLGGPCKTGI